MQLEIKELLDFDKHVTNPSHKAIQNPTFSNLIKMCNQGRS